MKVNHTFFRKKGKKNENLNYLYSEGGIRFVNDRMVLLLRRKEEYESGNAHRIRSDIVHCSSCGKT